MRVLVLSDTHAPRHWKSCPPALFPHLRAADTILHAGDVCVASVLQELESYAPVHAVLGNNDVPDVAEWGAPETLELTLEGVPVAMVHDSGPAKGRESRLRARFPGAGLVVFGHSHIPWDTTEDGVRFLNPGSPTDRRRQPVGTISLLHLEDAEIIAVETVAVTRPRR